MLHMQMLVQMQTPQRLVLDPCTACRYLRPPVTRFRLMDFHFMDRIVRDSNRRACAPAAPAASPEK